MARFLAHFFRIFAALGRTAGAGSSNSPSKIEGGFVLLRFSSARA